MNYSLDIGLIDKSIAVTWDSLSEEEYPKEIRIESPVRNTMFEWFYFKDSSVFRPAAIAFEKSEALNKKNRNKAKYTEYLPGTLGYKRFWKEEKNRCINGYEVGGVYIPGEYYFYLNYTRIKKTIVNKVTGKREKRLDFPDFTSMDFYWFLELERKENPVKFGLNENEKKGIISGKARRKGFSFKNAAGCTWTYTFFRDSYCIIASYYLEYADATFKFCKDMINFLNQFTEFRHPTIKKNEKMIHSGYSEKQDGQDVIKGYNSVIQIMTFSDGDTKAVGKSATRMIFEEAALFKNLKAAYAFSEPLFRDGDYFIGIPILFGTGGDMDNTTQDFSDIWRNPSAYGLSDYVNIYEKVEQTSRSGFFVSEMWYRPGKTYYKGKNYDNIDLNGNPYFAVSEYSLDLERDQKKKSDKKSYDLLITQKCKYASEAFLQTEGMVFPTVELFEVINKLIDNDKFKSMGIPVQLFEKPDGTIWYKPILNNELEPIYRYPNKKDMDRTGCVVIYDFPIYNVDGEVRKGQYFIGHDPFGIDSETGASLGAAFVMSGLRYPMLGYNKVVAEYVGRPSMKEYNRTMELLSRFYGNAKIMFENDRGEVKPYFEKVKRLSLLASQPDVVISKAISNSTINRIYGCSMSSVRMKAVGEQYIFDWLLEVRNRMGEDHVVRNIDLIPSIGLLEELLKYNRTGNFDRVMAFMQCMIYLEETYNTTDTGQIREDEKKVDIFDFLKKNKRIHGDRVTR